MEIREVTNEKGQDNSNDMQYIVVYFIAVLYFSDMLVFYGLA